MIDRLLEFGALLRRNGTRVSTAELLDAARALDIVGLDEPDEVRSALRATLVKRFSDRETFEELFDIFFLRAGGAGRGDGAPLLELLESRGFSEEEIESLLAILADEAQRLSPLARMGLGLRRGHLERLLRLAGLEGKLERMTSSLQIGFFSMQLLSAMGFSEAERELEGLRGPLARKLGEARTQEVLDSVAEIMAGLRRSVRDHVQEEFERRHLAERALDRGDELLDRPFSALEAAEISLLTDEVRRLARKLRSQASLRARRVRRGRLDVRKTIRRSFAAGGIPFDLRWRRRRPEKPRLVILCDISDSVRHVSRFMLHFTYLLQDLFSKVRSFVFVSEIGEATDLFRSHEALRAIELAQSGAVVNVYANSNFGRAFHLFRERYLDAIDSRTTVIVIGDGRNNYNLSHAGALAEMRRRGKRLLWLNPESRENWAFGDSVMREYEPHCDRIEVVYNLRSLGHVVDSLLL